MVPVKNATHWLFPFMVAFLLLAGKSAVCGVTVHQNNAAPRKAAAEIPKVPKGSTEDFSVPEPEVLLLVGGGLLLLSLVRKKKKAG
ncbi:MAG TPA: PEP-CTERM sorting domain-containing protein [Planctomycetes bacterium]|nr:PEP-CTERM sorting domain-containing protein [Planctomycetota bacterium]